MSSLDSIVYVFSYAIVTSPIGHTGEEIHKHVVVTCKMAGSKFPLFLGSDSACFDFISLLPFDTMQDCSTTLHSDFFRHFEMATDCIDETVMEISNISDLDIRISSTELGPARPGGWKPRARMAIPP